MTEQEYKKEFNKEYNRLKKLYQSIPENKFQLFEGLITQAARLKVQLDVLWLDIQVNGVSEEFQNGKDVEPISRERAESKLFTQLDKSYQAIIRQLSDHLPTETKKASKLDKLLDD